MSSFTTPILQMGYAVFSIWPRISPQRPTPAPGGGQPGSGVAVRGESPDPARGWPRGQGWNYTSQCARRGGARGGGPRLLPRSKSGNKRVSPASPPAHSRTLALGRTRNWHGRPERASERRAGDPPRGASRGASEPRPRRPPPPEPRSRPPPAGVPAVLPDPWR